MARLMLGSGLSLNDLMKAAPGVTRIALSPAALRRVRKGHQAVQRILKSGDTVYGVNTGFGRLKNVRIDAEHLRELQVNLLRSHAVGVGDLLPPDVTWRMMLLRLNSLLAGVSGVSVGLVKKLAEFLNAPLIPCVPVKGSVGASGDLAPLAHMALPLIGEGEVWSFSVGAHRHPAGISAAHAPSSIPAKTALKKSKILPISLGPKEGLALINGTQFTTAVLCEALARAERAAAWADVIGALSLDALLGTDRAFDARIHKARGQVGQQVVAAHLRSLLRGSELKRSHAGCDRVQDPYSLRCMPQVHGAARDILSHVRSVTSREIEAVTDNPLVFGDDVISGGNFHAEPVAMAADTLKLALCELASISERRIEQLVNPDLSHLPAFLTKVGGLNSGYMMAQVTAAALVSENKVLSHPASVDSIPTSANQEDHVSMGPAAARQALEIAGNLDYVLAIELLCACQALDLRRPLQSSPVLEKVRASLRRKVPFMRRDRRLSTDIEKARMVLREIPPR